MADYKPGSMDITEHEKTFDSFMKIVVRSVIGIILILIFLALVGT
jgi:hypothetical protein